MSITPLVTDLRIGAQRTRDAVVVTEPDPELVSAVDEAMAAALANMGPLLRSTAVRSMFHSQSPTPDELIERLRRARGEDPDQS